MGARRKFMRRQWRMQRLMWGPLKGATWAEFCEFRRTRARRAAHAARLAALGFEEPTEAQRIANLRDNVP